ncbi:MAG: helix-hairpin-helix domain-containing protein, partial [Terriglobales bacterium]
LAELVGLGEKTLAALTAAAISTVEQLGGMTPEQLQEIPGIGPKTMEKIFVAVNRFFGATVDEAAEGGESESAADAGGDDAEGPALTETPEGELERTGQTLEAEEVRGVLDAPDEAELPARDGLEPAPDAAAAEAGDSELGGNPPSGAEGRNAAGKEKPGE